MTISPAEGIIIDCNINWNNDEVSFYVENLKTGGFFTGFTSENIVSDHGDSGAPVYLGGIYNKANLMPCNNAVGLKDV